MSEADYSDVIDGMADTLWTLAWADHEEAHGRTYPGSDLFAEAPETPENARTDARNLAERISAANGEPAPAGAGLLPLWRRVAEGVGADPADYSEAWRFGYFLTMEALGHGVAWADDNPPHGLNVPDWEGGTVCDYWDYAEGVAELAEECEGDCPDARPRCDAHARLREREDAMGLVACVACGRTDAPLHPSKRCGYCGPEHAEHS